MHTIANRLGKLEMLIQKEVQTYLIGVEVRWFTVNVTMHPDSMCIVRVTACFASTSIRNRNNDLQVTASRVVNINTDPDILVKEISMYIALLIQTKSESFNRIDYVSDIQDNQRNIINNLEHKVDRIKDALKALPLVGKRFKGV